MFVVGDVAPLEPSYCPALASGRGASGGFCASEDGNPRSLMVVDGCGRADMGLPFVLGKVGCSETATRFVSVWHFKPEEREVLVMMGYRFLLKMLSF